MAILWKNKHWRLLMKINQEEEDEVVVDLEEEEEVDKALKSLP